MTAKRLDRSRTYGTIVGARDGSAWWQDGIAFDDEGYPIGAEKPASVPDTPGPSEVEAGSEEDMRSQLEALHPSQIKKLVEREGLVLVKGPGSKAKNIENLLAAG